MTTPSTSSSPTLFSDIPVRHFDLLREFDLLSPDVPIKSAAYFDGLKLLDNPIGTWKLSSGYLLAWENKQLRAELRLESFDPTLPPGMSVDGACTITWRLSMKPESNPLQSCAFECSIDRDQALEGGPSSGEGMDAITLKVDNGQVTLSTEDSESLRARALTNEWLPTRLAEYFGKFYEAPTLTSDYPISYLQKGLRLTIGRLNPGEQLQVKFVLAWKAETSVEDLSTWYAADPTLSCPPKGIKGPDPFS